MVADGELHRDPVQAVAVEKLQSLWHALLKYEPESGGGWRERFGLNRRPAKSAPKGLYLHGPVGRGKSMLMDLFYSAVAGDHKRRVHFHEFMLEMHGTMHDWRQKDGKLQDPLPKIAAEIAKDTWLLCFDEFQVDNIADAMILGRLFEALFEEGVVVIATSNTHPDNLYRAVCSANGSCRLSMCLKAGSIFWSWKRSVIIAATVWSIWAFTIRRSARRPPRLRHLHHQPAGRHGLGAAEVFRLADNIGGRHGRRAR